jgi:hypothetical protein
MHKKHSYFGDNMHVFFINFIENALIKFQQEKNIWGAEQNKSCVINTIGNNWKSQRGTQDFNMENPLQQRELKTIGVSQQNFIISGVFTNAVGYLMIRFNPSRRLTRSINRRRFNPSRRQISFHLSEVDLYFVEFGSTYNNLHLETNFLYHELQQSPE